MKVSTRNVVRCVIKSFRFPSRSWLFRTRALKLRREARMVSPAMGAAMIGTMYFLRANCAQHGGSASGGGLISASLLKLQGSIQNQSALRWVPANFRENVGFGSKPDHSNGFRLLIDLTGGSSRMVLSDNNAAFSLTSFRYIVFNMLAI